MILSSVQESGLDEDTFKNRFVSEVIDSSEMEDFIFSDSTWNGQVIVSDRDEFLKNVLYKVGGDSSGLVLERGEIVKHYVLRGEGAKELDFPVDFSYAFSAEYLISEDGNGYKVEKI